MAEKKKYTQYNLLLDPTDDEEMELIEFLKSKRGNKTKNSYSSILKRALRLLMEGEE